MERIPLNNINTNANGGRMGHEEVYSLLVSRELSWQQIISDLVKSEQLDPWDIDIAKLAQKYLEKVNELEDSNFIVPSKILLAASILLRIKSEILVDKYIRSLDEILFGAPDKKEKPPIEINLDDVSELFPRTPLPRQRRVTLPDLIQALNRAMATEHRRIKKEVAVKHALSRFHQFLPKSKTDVRFQIKRIFDRIKEFFSKGNPEKMTFSELSPTNEEKRHTFAPILHLDNQERVLLEQMKHFDEIYIHMKNGGSSDNIMRDMKEREAQYAEDKMEELVKESIELSIDNSQAAEVAQIQQKEELTVSKEITNKLNEEFLQKIGATEDENIENVQQAESSEEKVEDSTSAS